MGENYRAEKATAVFGYPVLGMGIVGATGAIFGIGLEQGLESMLETPLEIESTDYVLGGAVVGGTLGTGGGLYVGIKSCQSLNELSKSNNQ